MDNRYEKDLKEKFNLPKSVIAKCGVYYILRWDLNQLFFKIGEEVTWTVERNLYITHNNNPYQVLFHDCTPMELMTLSGKDHIFLSFRRLSGAPIGYVLVSLHFTPVSAQKDKIG